MFYDPMIAKLVTPRGDARGGDRAAGRGAGCLCHRRRRAQYSLSRRPDAAPALEQRAAIDRLHRRGVQRRLQAARRSPARTSRCSPRWRWRSITSATHAGARSPTRWGGRACASPGAGSPSSAASALRREVEGGLVGPTKVSVLAAKRCRQPSSRTRLRLVAGRAGLAGHGRRAPRVRAGARHSQRLRARLPGRARQGLRLYRARGRARRSDARRSLRPTPPSC